MNYLHWQEKTLADMSDDAVTSAYDEGFVLNRIGRGVVQQTRSCRIDLSKFELSSENRRILKKTEALELTEQVLPLGLSEDSPTKYYWTIGKMAKDFYEAKFGRATMTANKVKELLTDQDNSSFNLLLRYIKSDFRNHLLGDITSAVGYAICYANPSLLHYSYPFYDLSTAPKDAGLGMMIRAIEYGQSKGMKYIYLGSLQRPSDTYKLQFSGLEWFDGKAWQTDTEPLKEILKQA